jgi:cytoskeletal protein RodZ
MFKLVRKKSDDADIYLDEDELSAGLDYQGSKKATIFFQDYQATRSEESTERLREQMRKEMRRWTPIRIALYFALAIIFAVTVSALSFVFLNFVLHGGTPQDHRKPTVTVSASPRPIIGSASSPQISPKTMPAHEPQNKKSPKKNHISSLATPDTGNFTQPPATPSACVSCSTTSLPQAVGELVRTVQSVLKPVLGLVPDLLQSIGQAISPETSIPGSPAPTISTPAASGVPATWSDVSSQVRQLSGIAKSSSISTRQ